MNAIKFDFLIFTTLLLAFGLILLTVPPEGVTNQIEIGFQQQPEVVR
jgi:hypothetical protein